MELQGPCFIKQLQILGLSQDPSDKILLIFEVFIFLVEHDKNLTLTTLYALCTLCMRV